MIAAPGRTQADLPGSHVLPQTVPVTRSLSTSPRSPAHGRWAAASGPAGPRARRWQAQPRLRVRRGGRGGAGGPPGSNHDEINAILMSPLAPPGVTDSLSDGESDSQAEVPLTGIFNLLLGLPVVALFLSCASIAKLGALD